MVLVMISSAQASHPSGFVLCQILVGGIWAQQDRLDARLMAECGGAMASERAFKC